MLVRGLTDLLMSHNIARIWFWLLSYLSPPVSQGASFLGRWQLGQLATVELLLHPVIMLHILSVSMEITTMHYNASLK